MSVHALANDLLVILGDEKLSEADLKQLLVMELRQRWWVGEGFQGLPPALEDVMPPVPDSHSDFRRLASRVDFQNSQRRLIVGISILLCTRVLTCWKMPGWPSVPQAP